MKFASFLRPDGSATYGTVKGDMLTDLGGPDADGDLMSFIARGGLTRPLPKAAREYQMSDIAWLPVIPRPGKIFCIGLNYSEHIAETGRGESEHPVIFMRTATSQTAHGADLVRPAISDRFDYEGELALIVGTPGRDIAEADALAHVGGYACYNDVTVRDWQKHTHQWTPGKNFDHTGAFGPWMVTTDELPDRRQARLTTRVNGKVVQQALLAQMVFPFEALIAYISRFTKLEAGDVIVTGTPGGVGDRRSPPLYLQPGDTVEVEVDGVGVLRNPVVAQEGDRAQ